MSRSAPRQAGRALKQKPPPERNTDNPIIQFTCGKEAWEELTNNVDIYKLVGNTKTKGRTPIWKCLTSNVPMSTVSASKAGYPDIGVWRTVTGTAEDGDHFLLWVRSRRQGKLVRNVQLVIKADRFGPITALTCKLSRFSDSVMTKGECLIASGQFTLLGYAEAKAFDISTKESLYSDTDSDSLNKHWRSVELLPAMVDTVDRSKKQVVSRDGAVVEVDSTRERVQIRRRKRG